MRAIAIDANEHGGLGSLVDEMHQLRARVFAGRLGWRVKIENGRERDEYDALDPTYILALTERGDLAGCARLLLSTGPTMLSCTFPQVLPGGRATGQIHHGREFALLRRHARREEARPVPAVRPAPRSARRCVSDGGRLP
ncbi:acyl-homoserine-lactone synthase [Bradyrhizobium sp. Leo121]|uniref:acyl-homoserine-lactone synthase n=1 Tax=Bradyrhizobium sp. Leo121 TaxID=1571195 RepID=UPI001FE015A0|nr:acyl-homoserine-lactone synthase [Bradyrhizobium sp. Leo121]